MHKSREIGLLLFFVCMTTVAFPQYTGYRNATDLESIKQQFAKAADKITSIKSRFTQEKNLSMLSETIISEGQFWFKRPGKIRLEYTKPFQYLVVLNGDQALIRDEQKESKIPAQASKALRQVNHLLADVMGGKILSNSDFTSRVFENEKNYLVELTPKSKQLASIYKNINIFVDRKDVGLSTMELLEKNGDKTVMKFTQKEFNADLPESLFSVH